MSNLDNPPRVVLFTSSVPRESKTVTSLMTALTSQQMGKSAIIVDCDIRLPSLSEIVGAPGRKPGLLKVVTGEVDYTDAIIEFPATSGLHILPVQKSELRSRVAAADLLSSNRFANLIETLRAKYDIVILDAPPVLVVPDAKIIAPLVDAVVHVVRWDSTPKGAVMEGLRELQNVDAPIAGVVLSVVNEAKAERYTYKGQKYYKGKFKDYYVT